MNLLAQDDDSAGNLQFRINYPLIAGQDYVLVVTTWSNNVVGSFGFFIFGPPPVNLTYIRTGMSPP